MQRLKVASTKSNLLKLKDQLRFAKEGKQLLTQKREVLVMELMRLQDDAQKIRDDLDALLARAYRVYVNAVLREGRDILQRLATAVPPVAGVKVEMRSVMGVVLPIVDGSEQPAPVRFGLGRGTFAIDQAAELFDEVRRKILEAAETETAIYRLANETRKTLHREKALENLFIPQYQSTVKFIEENLEEKERESFYQLKLVKGDLG